jgi:biopolymer transport protein ExbB
MLNTQPTRRQALAYALVALALCWMAVHIAGRPPAWSQEPETTSPSSAPPPAAAPATSPTPAVPAADDPFKEGFNAMNFFVLLYMGGVFMIPIGVMSIIAVAVMIERGLALRRSKVLPPELVEGLGQLGGSQGGFDPRKAYRICQQYPSAAANVIKAMLLKVGRPQSEVEHTVKEVSEREASRLYANVRYLNLATAVAPLIGLLGTVWGMIIAFHHTTVLVPGQNKANELASGIYVALVTTLGGLLVAIPSAMFAHYFEGRIQMLFHHIDELLFNLMPQIERFEGRMRFGRPLDGESSPNGESEPAAPPVEAV